MMNHDSKRPVTLEDILRLKRAERPPAEFWDRFDRELRAKQLAALVEKRPWWRTLSLPQVFASVRRFHVPLGAAAVLAVTILSVREYNVPATGSDASPVLAAPAVAAAPAAPAAAEQVGAVAVPAAGAVESFPAASAQLAAAESAPAASLVVLSSNATPSGDFAQLISLGGGPATAEETTAVSSPSARLIAETFAALQAEEPMLSRQLLSPARGFETRVLPARNRPVEPLAQMKVPSGSRRSNLIASATLASTTAPVVTSDRSARGLSDERLYETISRVNARGAGMLVKF